MSHLIQKPTQKARVLEALEKADGDWVNGQYFLRTLLLSQFHARIKELEEEGVEIEHSEFKDEFGFKSYRLKAKETLF